MAEGTREYKRIETMLKELKDSDQERKKDIARVKERIEGALEEIRLMINGMTLQNNDLRNQGGSREGDIHRGSILGQPTGVTGESSVFAGNSCNFRYTTKLEFPKFNGDNVEEWLFKV